MSLWTEYWSKEPNSPSVNVARYFWFLKLYFPPAHPAPKKLVRFEGGEPSLERRRLRNAPRLQHRIRTRESAGARLWEFRPLQNLCAQFRHHHPIVRDHLPMEEEEVFSGTILESRSRLLRREYRNPPAFDLPVELFQLRLI
jgi:hypothetical protein